MIRAVSIDFGGTLAAHRQPVSDILASELRQRGFHFSSTRLSAGRPSPEQVRRAIFDAATRGGEGWVVALRQLYRGWIFATVCIDAEAADIIADAVLYKYSTSMNWRSSPTTGTLFTILRCAGIPAVVLSNWGPSLATTLQQFPWSDGLAGVLSSSSIKAAKPRLAAFRAAADVLNCEPAHLLHIGDDRACDYLGARLAGSKALLVGRAGDCMSRQDLTNLCSIVNVATSDVFHDA